MESGSWTAQDAVEWFAGEQPHSLGCDSYVHFQMPSGHREHGQSVWNEAYWIRLFGFDIELTMKGIAVVNLRAR